MKTLAELKRIAKTGKYEARIIKWYENTNQEELPERLRGWRKLVDSNSNSISFLNSDGKKSSLWINRAAQIEYDGNTLTFYKEGLRELTPEEKTTLDEWKAITETEQYRKDSWYDAMTDYNGTFYQKKRFFEDRDMLYLAGWEKVRGMRYDHRTNKIYDERIHDEPQIQYEFRLVEA